MHDFMDIAVAAFSTATNWPESRSYAHILEASERLLDFSLPTDLKLQIASRASQHTATQLTLNNSGAINGSLAYISTTAALKEVQGSHDILLQQATSTNDMVVPAPQPITSPQFQPHSLFYGRLHFPQSALEAMLIRRLTPQTQLLVKCISSDRLRNGGTLTAYLQHNTRTLHTEYVFSTNEALLGLRTLYSLHSPNLNTTQYDNSSLAVGAELWYGCLNMSPGLSVAGRYATQSSYTGSPVVITMAMNPILGEVSSSYSVRTGINSSFGSRYDFNVYSYESNLSFGCELFKYGSTEQIKPGAGAELTEIPLPLNYTMPMHQHRSSLRTISTDEHHMTDVMSVPQAFETMVNKTPFSSLVKIAANLGEQELKLKWEGKWNGILLSAGMRYILGNVDVKGGLKGCGVSVQYSS